MISTRINGALLAAASLVLLSVTQADAKPARAPDGVFHECPSLNPEAAARVAKVTSQFAYGSPSGKFVINYDTTGDSAVPPGDSDGDSVPDWVETAALIADSVLHQYALMGYDTTLNVVGQYPITMVKMGYYGLTSSSPPRISIDNDFDNSTDHSAFFETEGLDGLEVTIAHEMFHAVQFHYVSYGQIAWWMEATATFMEEIMYDDVNDYYQYIDPEGWDSAAPSIYGAPEMGLGYNNVYLIYPYSAAVFPIFLMERYGRSTALNIVKETFVLNSLSSAAVVESVVDGTGAQNIQQVLAEFWTWNYFTDTRAMAGQFFEEGANYGPAPLDKSEYDSTGAHTISNLSSVGTASGTLNARGLGAVLFRVEPDGSPGGFHLSLSDIERYAGDAVNDWAWRVVVREGTAVRAYSLPSTLEGTTWQIDIAGESGEDWTNASDIVVIGANGVPSGSSTVYFSYTIDYDSGLVGISNGGVPERASLGQNVPNPFNPSTSIPVELTASGPISLVVYDITGQTVATLADGYYTAGSHRFVWDGTTASGRPAGAGVYLVRLAAEGVVQARRMVLVR